MNVRDMTKDDILDALGLETQKSNFDYLLPALGIFSAGMLIGAGVGMMFAPKRGEELRRDIGEHLPRFRKGNSGTHAEETRQH